jgi:signal transduction histidine kinase
VKTATLPRVLFQILSLGIALLVVLTLMLRLAREVRLNRQQTEFLATVTHELKTPIATLDLTSSLLRSGGLSSEETERLWNSHEVELKRLREDVETLLQAARLQSMDTGKQRTMPVALERWLQDSLDRWTIALGPGATLLREGPPLPESVQLDLRSLNLIADNLLDNARKYARGIPRVFIRTAPTRSPILRRRGWRIEFRDEGWGFDPHDRRRIFERFVRSRSLAPYSIPGTGLGLFLVKSAGEALGLRVRAQSGGHGTGAVFTVEGWT